MNGIRPVRKGIRVLAARELPMRVRTRLVRLHLPGSQAARIELPQGPLSVASVQDRDAFEEIFVDGEYDGAYEGAAVLDLGAHKGYFGAYAFARGATAVLSYEPEATNFGFLARAAREFRSRGFAWDVERAAVGASDGSAELHVSTRSWSHSLIARPDRPRRRTLRTEAVPKVALATAISRARAGAAGRLVVKMDIEGAECETVLGSPAHVWDGVDEFFIEMHPFAACPPDAVLARLRDAGLGPVRAGETARLVRIQSANPQEAGVCLR